jgi:hypothetical protein
MANANPNRFPHETSGDLLLRKVEQALAMSREERFRAGGDLFAFACETARAAIRASLGNDDPEKVESRLHQRLRVQEELERSSRQ